MSKAKKGITNPSYDTELTEALENLRSSLTKDLRKLILAYALVVFFLTGAAMEHYFPEWLTFLW